jgi:hypothetical protein
MATYIYISMPKHQSIHLWFEEGLLLLFIHAQASMSLALRLLMLAGLKNMYASATLDMSIMRYLYMCIANSPGLLSAKPISTALYTTACLSFHKTQEFNRSASCL